MHLRYTLPVIGLTLLLAACRGGGSGESRGPIKLGDSSTIVTETNEALLQDQVPDLKPVIASEQTGQPSADTTVQQPSNDRPTTVQPTTAMSGLVVSFKEVTINITGISAKSFGKTDLQKARGASYELTSGNLVGAQLRTSLSASLKAGGGEVTKVSQRYETVIMLQDGGDKLPLESLGKYTSAWQPLSGNAGVYNITGLESSGLGFKPANAAAIRNAVQQAARKARLSRADRQEWLESVKNIRAANQSPATVVLRSVMWRVEGKGFSKELRVDVPF